MVAELKLRGFEVCKGWEDKGITLPLQATEYSAGYDFCVAEYVTVWPIATNPKPTVISTGIKAYMKAGEVLQLYVRSSLSKKGLQLANSCGIVDKDYYQNIDNDGHIMFALWNHSSSPVDLKKGDRIGQGIFMNYLKADGERSTTKREGGFGSTNDKN